MSLTLTSEEARLFDWAKESLPSWMVPPEREAEELKSWAKVFHKSLQVVEFWSDMTYVGRATSGAADEPDWLDGLARELGTKRAAGESDVGLRERLRTTAPALTREAILSLANAVLALAGVSGQAALEEVRRDKAYFGTYTAQTGTGGTFSIVPDILLAKFEPTVPFAGMIELNYPRSGANGNPRVVLSGAASAGNDGTFELFDLDNDAAVYDNVSAVAEVDPTVSWELRQYDVEGNDRTGRARAYLGRGYTIGRRPPGTTIVLILPYGTTEATRAGIDAAVRKIKAGGVALITQRRQSP